MPRAIFGLVNHAISQARPLSSELSSVRPRLYATSLYVSLPPTRIKMAENFDKKGYRVLGATLQQLLSNESSISYQVPFWIKFACKAMLAKGVSYSVAACIIFSCYCSPILDLLLVLSAGSVAFDSCPCVALLLMLTPSSRVFC